jgi:hypothetical protein
MTQVQQALGTVFNELADNDANAITAQFVRDAIESVRPRGGTTSVPAPGGTLNVLNSLDYVLTTGPWWQDNDGDLFNDVNDTGRLTYTGDVPILAIAYGIVSVSAGNNDVLHLVGAQNGVINPQTHGITKMEANNSTVNIAIAGSLIMQPSDYLELMMRNQGGGDIELITAQIVLTGIPAV